MHLFQWMDKVLLQKMFGFQYQSQLICCVSLGKLLGEGRREKGRAEETNSLSAKTLRFLSKESYTSVISFRRQITFFKLIGSDRQNISSEFIRRHPFTAPQNVFWATTDKTFSKSVQIQSFPVKVFSLLLFTTDGMKAFPLSPIESEKLVLHGHCDLAAEIFLAPILQRTGSRDFLQHSDHSHNI